MCVYILLHSANSDKYYFIDVSIPGCIPSRALTGSLNKHSTNSARVDTQSSLNSLILLTIT